MKPVEILLTFDTTGSMYGCLAQVRESAAEMVESLFKSIPVLKVGVIAHGDYCDNRPGSYVTKIFDLSSNPKQICKFINDVGRTDGGDAEECYELVLRQGRTQISWTAGSTKAMVLIGDNNPHPKTDPQNTSKIDWHNELKLLLEAGISVYAVHALGNNHVRDFYEEVARVTKGYYLELDQFSMIEDMILAVCYKQMGGTHLQDFEDAVTQLGRMNRSRDVMFSTLSGRKPARFKKSKLQPVESGRFQGWTLRKDCPITDYVERKGFTYNRTEGRGFYQFTKKSKIQDYKEIILEDKATGDMFTGDAVRKILDLPTSGTIEVRPAQLTEVADQYNIFVQSTSSNRNLKAGTRFLYDIRGL